MDAGVKEGSVHTEQPEPLELLACERALPPPRIGTWGGRVMTSHNS